jgi:hypothetical protein
MIHGQQNVKFPVIFWFLKNAALSGKKSPLRLERDFCIILKQKFIYSYYSGYPNGNGLKTFFFRDGTNLLNLGLWVSNFVAHLVKLRYITNKTKEQKNKTILGYSKGITANYPISKNYLENEPSLQSNT